MSRLPRVSSLAALALYRDAPLHVRLHVRARALVCPMAELVLRAPRGGSLLDVGSGHGLFANEVALRDPRARVLGIDPSPEKVRWARATIGDRAGVEFRVASLESTREEGFDAVAVLDVLYLVPRARWPAFLAACRARLRPGGRLLLKEVDVAPRWKFYASMAREVVSVRLLGITMGSSSTFAFASRSAMCEILESAGLRVLAVTPMGEGYLSPHVLYEAIRV